MSKTEFGFAAAGFDRWNKTETTRGVDTDAWGAGSSENGFCAREHHPASRVESERASSCLMDQNQTSCDFSDLGINSGNLKGANSSWNVERNAGFCDSYLSENPISGSEEKYRVCDQYSRHGENREESHSSWFSDRKNSSEDDSRVKTKLRMKEKVALKSGLEAKTERDDRDGREFKANSETSSVYGSQSEVDDYVYRSYPNDVDSHASVNGPCESKANLGVYGPYNSKIAPILEVSSNNVLTAPTLYGSHENEVASTGPYPYDRVFGPIVYGPDPTDVSYTVKFDPRYSVRPQRPRQQTGGLFNRKAKFE